MPFGLDYVTGPPVANLKSAGVTFVCRYLSEVNALTQVKLLTLAEAKMLSASDIALVSNYEWYANRALESAASGVQDAHRAAEQHATCGGPADRPIYFSVDCDCDGSQVVNYFKGVASVIGLARTGAYGSYRVLKYLFDNDLITWGWQTYAWSSGLWEERCHIQQYQNGMNIGGHSVDYDRSLKSDYGQWFVGGVEPTMSIDLSTPGVSSHFTAVPGNSNQWQCIQTGKVIQYGILAAYQKYGNSALCGLTFLGLPVSDEVPIQNISSIYQHLAGKGIVVQFFERGVVAYDVAHLIDNPPGSGSVYAVHLYGLPGQDPAIVTLEGQITTLDAEIAQLKASQSPALDPNKVANRLQAVALLAKQQEQLALAPLS